MTNENLARPALFALLLFILAIASWEIYLRNDGSDNAYDDTPALFAHTRGQVYLPKDESTVFIGSSRIKFDLEYLRNWSLRLDLLIILKTIALVVKDSRAF